MSDPLSLEAAYLPADAVQDDYQSSPWLPRWWNTSFAADYGYSALASSAILLLFIIGGVRHWMILPVWICGIIAGADIVRWARDEIDVFDPKFLVSVFLYLALFLVPLMHVYYDTYGWDLYVSNWPRWLGYMAFLNLGGLLAFKLSQRIFYSKAKPVRGYWQVDPARIFAIGFPVLCVSAVAMAVIHIFFGGLVRVAGEAYGAVEVRTQYAPYISFIRMFSDPLVPLSMMLIICWLVINKPQRSRSNMTMFVLLGITFVFQFIAVGLRGSRIAILLGFLTVVIIIHFTLRPIPKKWILIGLAALVVFAYLYDFRKKVGLEGWEVFRSPQVARELAEERGVGLHNTVMADFSRTDVQAQILYNLTENADIINYEYEYGRTYLEGILRFIPRAIWPTKPYQIKGQAAGRLLHADELRVSTRQYGVAGEAMMNFGPVAVIPAFFVFGVIVGFMRKKILTLSYGDSRLFLAPILIILFGNMVTMDTDNIIFHLLLIGALPFIVFFFGSIRKTQYAPTHSEYPYGRMFEELDQQSI